MFRQKKSIIAYIVLVVCFEECMMCYAGTECKVRKDMAEDDVIMSQNYPQPYPTDTDMTWEWEVTEGRWVVFFQDFDLDPDDSDWLEVNESTRILRYMLPSTPTPSYVISEVPHVTIRFHSDKYTKPTSRGFKIKLLYGKEQKDLDFKIHEQLKKKAKTETEPDNSHVLVLVAGTFTACVCLFTIIGIAICCHFKGRTIRVSITRDAFGVRRNSGVSHTRGANSRSENGQGRHEPRPSQGDGASSQSDQSRPSFQRLDSRLGWRARAELNTTQHTTTTSRPLSRPNIYTPTADSKPGPSHNVSIQTSRENGTADLHCTSTTTSRGNVTSDRRGVNTGRCRPSNGSDRRGDEDRSRHVSGGSRKTSRRPSKPKKEETSLKGAGSVSSEESCINVVRLNAREEQDKFPELLREYSDTSDCLQLMKRSHSEPSSPYENVLPLLPVKESRSPEIQSPELKQLDFAPPPYAEAEKQKSANCYSNVPLSEASPKTTPDSQTNIYINAHALSEGAEASSSNNIFINAVGISVGNHDSSTEMIVFGEKDTETPGNKILRKPQISPRNGRQKENSSSEDNDYDTVQQNSSTSTSSVHIVDGYAYIIPKSLQATKSSETNQVGPAAKSDGSVLTSASVQLDLVAESASVRKKQKHYENGYADFPKNQSGSDGVYVNVSLGD